jgi:hypothetical protein
MTTHIAARLLLILLIPAGILLLPACNARKDYPEPAIGWHSPTFSVVYGTLRTLPGRTPQDNPTWVITFGSNSDPYQGLLAITPPEKLIGYAGGERVEVKGRILDQPTTDAFNGRWYVVDSIQLWSDYR